MPYMKEHVDAGIKVRPLSNVTTGRKSPYNDQLGSPGRTRTKALVVNIVLHRSIFSKCPFGKSSNVGIEVEWGKC